MISFLWALVGALLSLLVYVAWEHLLLLRRPHGFFGERLSSWQPTVDSGWHWVRERLNVRRRFGRVVLEKTMTTPMATSGGVLAGSSMIGTYLVNGSRRSRVHRQLVSLFLPWGSMVATWLGSSLERRSPVQSWQVALFSVERS